MEQVGKMLDKILMHYEKREYDAAEKLLDKLLEGNPGYHKGCFLKAILLEETGRAEEAKEFFERSGNVFTMMFRLALQLEDTDPSRALTYYDRLTQMDPRNNMLWFNRGLICEKMGDQSGARESFSNLQPSREIVSRILIPLGFMICLLGGGVMMILRGNSALASLVIVSAVFCLFWLRRDAGQALQMRSKKKQYGIK
ncbi:MAG: tetratricopeptide repeat protein [Nitrospiraceae bacterium]|nr:tetratricopeptide repeat protein [Nitrospiraceae bacterium]